MQQMVILARSGASDGALAPLGSRREILAGTQPYNTAPDRDGGDILYGPGIRIELPPGEPITQMLLSVTEEEIAWQVIMKMARQLAWRLYDPVSGRELNP